MIYCPQTKNTADLESTVAKGLILVRLAANHLCLLLKIGTIALAMAGGPRTVLLGVTEALEGVAAVIAVVTMAKRHLEGALDTQPRGREAV